MQKIKRQVSISTPGKVGAAYLRGDIPEFCTGGTVEVDVKVVKGKTRHTRIFKDVAVHHQGGGVRETFTAHKMSLGIDVERTFPVHSPNISEIRIAFRGDVRRAKLYCLRNLCGKTARIKERR